MNVVGIETVRHARLFIVSERLAEDLRPAQVVRHLGITALFIDPRTPRAEAVQWSVDSLTIAERQYLRAALAQPPIGAPLDDWIMEDPVCEWFPPALRFPDATSRDGEVGAQPSRIPGQGAG